MWQIQLSQQRNGEALILTSLEAMKKPLFPLWIATARMRPRAYPQGAQSLGEYMYVRKAWRRGGQRMGAICILIMCRRGKQASCSEKFRRPETYGGLSPNNYYSRDLKQNKTKNPEGFTEENWVDWLSSGSGWGSGFWANLPECSKGVKRGAKSSD